MTEYNGLEVVFFCFIYLEHVDIPVLNPKVHASNLTDLIFFLFKSKSQCYPHLHRIID